MPGHFPFTNRPSPKLGVRDMAGGNDIVFKKLHAKGLSKVASHNLSEIKQSSAEDRAGAEDAAGGALPGGGAAGAE
eukprot:9467213-Pyramimonas_sp.AAC.1